MSIRTQRVAELIQREVARILQRDYADQLKPMVTITNARVTKDLSIAYLYASVLGDTSAKREAAFKQLKTLTPEIRDELASRIRHQLRTVPEIKFFLDESLQKAKKMENLFDRIREERERREARNGDPEATAKPHDADAQGAQAKDAQAQDAQAQDAQTRDAQVQDAQAPDADEAPAADEPAADEPADADAPADDGEMSTAERIRARQAAARKAREEAARSADGEDADEPNDAP